MLDHNKSYVEFVRVLVDDGGSKSSVVIREGGWDREWPNIIDSFVDFLRACGYNFTDQEFADAVNEEYGCKGETT